MTKTTVLDHFGENERKIISRYYLVSLWGYTIIPIVLAITPIGLIENNFILTKVGVILELFNNRKDYYEYLEGIKYGLGLKYILIIYILTYINLAMIFFITCYITIKWNYSVKYDKKEDNRRLMLFLFGFCAGLFFGYFGGNPPSDPKYLSTGRFFRNELVLYAVAACFFFMSFSWAGIVTYTLKITGFRGLRNGA